MEWPKGLLTERVDEKGSHFGSKTTMLESVGLLLPLLVFPDVVAGKNLLFKVDNTAVLWGWNSGYVRNDETATEVLKSVSYLAGYLGTPVHVEHVDRMSEDLACLADEMSRRSVSKHRARREVLETSERWKVDSFLNQWLEDPSAKGDLCGRLMKELKNKKNYVILQKNYRQKYRNIYPKK